MKKLLVVCAIICLISVANALPVGVELGAGYTIHENNDHFFISGGALVNIHENFYLRTTLAQLSFFEDGNSIYIGTGSGLDLMMFSYAPKFAPYGLGGLHINNGGGVTSINLRLGVGSEFEISKAFKPFAEISLDVIRTSTSGNSNTETPVTIKGGIRIK
jgi:hypothetical protein